MTGIPVRKDVAMTGEITLRGRVLPIGGLKEKLLAALRGGIKQVLIPEDNAKDLADIPDNVKSGLEIVPVARMDDVLEARAGPPAGADRVGRGKIAAQLRWSPTTTLRPPRRRTKPLIMIDINSARPSAGAVVFSLPHIRSKSRDSAVFACHQRLFAGLSRAEVGGTIRLSALTRERDIS